MNNCDYIKYSLELHLFFARIMKEHSFFLEIAFMERDMEFKRVANDFQMAFASILDCVVDLADGNVSSEMLASNEIVTKNTLDAETQSSCLSGVNIDSQITLKELNLMECQGIIDEQIMNSIHYINQQALPLIRQLIEFKNNVLNNVLNCQMFTANYPLLITHIMNEAKMYHDLLQKIENNEIITQEYILQQEMFWNNIMKEHAQFIRGLLDPSEQELIDMANEFAKKYENIISVESQNISQLTETSLNQTIDFRDFKVTGEEGILSCKVRSIIIPLLADHVVREANHFIRLLQSFAS